MSKPVETDETCNTGRRNLMKATGIAVAAMGMVPMASATQAFAQTSSWDKVFPKSDNVDHQKVSFKNRYALPWQVTSTCQRTAKVRLWPPLSSAAPSVR